MSDRIDPQVLAHLEWLGFVQPTGLVVSAPALVRAGAILDRGDAEGQALLRECIEERPVAASAAPVPIIRDFPAFARSVLGWSFSTRAYAGTPEQPVPAELEVSLEGEPLRPDFAVRELEPQDGKSPWQLLVSTFDSEDEFDRASARRGSIALSPHGRMERLLRQTGVAAGLLFNGRALRLLSAPYGESSGWLDFRVADMAQMAGRPIAAAMRLLLREQRLLSLPRAQRLASLLDESRRFQNEVSERLAEQVLHALYELLRGFQQANEKSGGALLRYTLADHPDEVYRGLLTVLLRLVFLLYAEELVMLPGDETFRENYSLAGLYKRLREDAALYPDTMDSRYGAWAQLLSLFRMIHDGAMTAEMRLPKRHGALFDPDSYPFLEGRFGGARQIHERIEPPLVPDGTIWRVLEKLLVLDGERLSYRALDVEQIGSVYETMMGFRLERTAGPSIAVKAQKKYGAPTAIDLEELLSVPGDKREKWITERTDRKLSDSIRKGVKAAQTIDDVHAALAPVVDRRATPDVVPPGSMVLQPSEERRRSGSHYTPRALTEPIVRTTLEPILRQLRSEDGRPSRPERILDLKVCDPAMGSGAFLVEACRQLGDALLESWRAYGAVPAVPLDETEEIFARRLVAQRCLYGVDRNPVAVDLAKVSLWLFTLAREHPLTFIDHALRHGDSLVGLTRHQIEAFQWDESGAVLKGLKVREPLDRYLERRNAIRTADEKITDRELRELWHAAEADLAKVRLFGDLVISAFFEGRNDKERTAKRNEYLSAVLQGAAEQYQGRSEDSRHTAKPLAPFHWEVEFPEVFQRVRSGFDAIAGNPPFLGAKRISTVLGDVYRDWLSNVHAGASSNVDLVAHFFRRSFSLIREGGAFGLIATNTIAQGDTRAGGLRWICENGGEIYSAHTHLKWPGLAAVVVSLINVIKGRLSTPKRLDDHKVELITAYLFHRGHHGDPRRLGPNTGVSFQGSILLGTGFTFDDTAKNGAANSLDEMRRLIDATRANQEVIFPYIGGEEVNTDPTHAHHRYAINFAERGEDECRQRWPDLMEIAETKVKPERILKSREIAASPWWQYWRSRRDLYAAVAGMERVLVNSQVSAHLQFAFLPSRMVFAHTLNVFLLPSYAAFCALQSRPHEIWARFFGSTLEDRLRYTPSDCFETFPFPGQWLSDPRLDAAGKAYYEFRAALMVRNNEGLTKTYNRFHEYDPRDPDILKLRELHAAMDGAVLDAYGWTDIPTTCEPLLDYEIDEEEWGDRKKPYRYRWPDEVRDEVLARLLELNAQRAADEVRAGARVQKIRPVKRARVVEAADPGEGAGRRSQERTFRRIVLSAEIVHRLHNESKFGRVKHQKIFHLCEYIAELPEIEGQYHRDAAGPLDNRLIYTNEQKLKQLKWYETYERKLGHGYRPMEKAGDHEKYLERYWPEKLSVIRNLIDIMRPWDTLSCEIFSTAYAVWNDLLLLGREVSDDAILDEILNRWHESKRRVPERRWRDVFAWMREQGYVPRGFGKPTVASVKAPARKKRTDTPKLF